MKIISKYIFKYRGTRIRKLHTNSYLVYFLLLCLPVFSLVGFFFYKKVYPTLIIMIQNNEINYKKYLFLIIPSLLLISLNMAVVNSLQRYSKMNGGFFARLFHKQMIARMLISRNFYETKKIHGSNGKVRDKIKLPKVYYQHSKEKATTSLTFPTDGGKLHDQFLKIGKTLEEMFTADLTEIKKEQGFTTYNLIIDTQGNRINIHDMVVEGTKIRLMNGLVWDFAESPHLLCAGGTGGGKSYFLFSLILAFMKVGTVDLCDPKQADLMDLGDLKAFKGHVFTGTEWITRCLANAEKEMNKRYVYMKSLPNYVTGKNYAYYGIPPHFVIVDEWVAFYSTLDYKEQAKVMKHLQQLILKARQAGIFIILAMQRPDAEYLGGGVRDNMMFRVTLGQLAPTAYYMVFGEDSKNKDFYNADIRGRGYVSDGTSIPREFFSPLVPKDFNFMEVFSKQEQMIEMTFDDMAITKEEIQDVEKEFCLPEIEA